MDKFLYYLAQTISGIGPFLLLLGLLIFVHELGHFLVAKFFGVRVEVFSLGFGKKLLQKKIGDTVYCISVFPIGGYVKMYGDDPSAEVPQDQKRYAFLHKPVWPRIAIVLAGPLMNLFFAIILFAIIGGVGEQLPAALVGDVNPTSKAYEAGFRPGDKILTINGEAVPSWIHARDKIEASGGKHLSMVVRRTENGRLTDAQIEVTPVFGENENIFSMQNTVGKIEGLGIEARATLVGISHPESPAAKAGLQSLDVVTSVNGTKVSAWREMEAAFAVAAAGGAKEVTIEARPIEDETQKDIRSMKLQLPKSASEDPENMLAALGIETAELFIYRVKDKAPAAAAGLLPKDKLVKVNGEPVHAWSDVIERVKKYDPAGAPFVFTVVRDGQEKAFELRPEMTALMNGRHQEEQRFTVGIVSGFLQVIPETVFYKLTQPGDIIRYGFRQSAQWTGFVVMSLVRLVAGDVSAKNIGGVITIGRVANMSYEAGLSAFLKTMAIISINLFLLNLLPVPILDGGHLVFFSIEALRGAPLSMRKMEIAQQVGLMLLMFLMVFAFFNDITNLLASRW